MKKRRDEKGRINRARHCVLGTASGNSSVYCLHKYSHKCFGKKGNKEKTQRTLDGRRREKHLVGTTFGSRSHLVMNSPTITSQNVFGRLSLCASTAWSVGETSRGVLRERGRERGERGYNNSKQDVGLFIPLDWIPQLQACRRKDTENCTETKEMHTEKDERHREQQAGRRRTNANTNKGNTSHPYFLASAAVAAPNRNALM